MTVEMRRNDYEPDDSNGCQHAGLLLDRGFKEWSDDKHNDDIVKLHHQASKIPFSPTYKKSYQQWYKQQLSNHPYSAIWFARLENRLFLGMGEASPLEAGITLHHTYGVPFIPGSAIKGVLHHYAQEVAVSDDIQAVLFGKEASQTDKRECGEAGYIIYNDAWWIPITNKPALAPEIITVHHQDYYSSLGKDPATDFDSPNPNPQIAIQGSFMFSLKGDEKWVKYAIALLKDALKHRGIGAKNSSGYGFFAEDEKQIKSYKKEQHDTQIKSASSPEVKFRLIVDNIELKDLPILLGRNRKTTANDDIGKENWDLYLQLILEEFGDEIKEWESLGKNDNRNVAYRVIHGSKAITWEET